MPKEENIDFILAVGSGSVIDGCKYLAAASLYDGDGWDFLDGTSEVQKALPIGVVLTLAATGSESNHLTVVSKKETDEKRMYFQIGHELTAYYNLDHARSLAVVQPYLLEVMGEEKKEKIAQLGKNVFGIESNNADVIKAIVEVYNKVETILTMSMR